ncbi:MAG: chemotaxis protein CheW [Spirochaetia bacterium]|nr:chemotaxis protein CheW [Spirochaetia bacterium]
MSKEEMQDSDFFDETDDEIQENKFLMCRIGNEIYGIDIQHVTDIIELQKITEVPDMPEYVKGVINLRGNVIPVIDMRLRFGMDSKEFDDRTVITVVNIKNYSIGFIVDTATEVVDIPEKNIDPPPSFKESGEKNKYIAGLGKIDDQVIILLDMEKLVGQEEIESIQSGVS